MDNKETATQLTFSIDLLIQAGRHIEFLRSVAETQHLRNENILKRAAYRYEKYWLPLAAKYPEECLVAPLDIEWVWLCHMLSPKNYERDCINIVGSLIHHTFYNEHDRQQRLHVSENLWMQMYGPNEEQFYIEASVCNASTLDDFTSSLSYDLVAASRRQATFYDKISSTGNINEVDLDSNLDRYKQFIYLCKLFPTLYFTPAVDIDLLWHTHQANPQAYKKDMVKILQRLLHHDDSSTDEMKFGEITSLTEKTWEKLYKEPCLADTPNMTTCYNRCTIK